VAVGVVAASSAVRVAVQEEEVRVGRLVVVAAVRDLPVVVVLVAAVRDLVVVAVLAAAGQEALAVLPHLMTGTNSRRAPSVPRGGRSEARVTSPESLS
jgi:hypothetical protein